FRSWTWNYANNFNVHQQSIPTAEARRGDTTTFMGYSDRLTLSGKYTALKYINLTPSVNLSQLWSATERTGDSLNPTRNAFAPTGGRYGHYFAAWNANVKAETRLFGLAQAADDPWFGRITAARHTITPSATFTFAPELDSNRRLFTNPRIGGAAFQSEQKSVTLGLGNDVDFKILSPGQATPGDTTTRQTTKPESYKLLSANSAITHNFAQDVRPWSDLNSDVSLYLTRNVAFTINATHTVYDPFRDPDGYASQDPTSPANDLTTPILKNWGFGWRKGLEIAGGPNSGSRMRD